MSAKRTVTGATILDKYPQLYSDSLYIQVAGGTQNNTKLTSMYTQQSPYGLLIHRTEWTMYRIAGVFDTTDQMVKWGLAFVPEQAAAGHMPNTLGVLEYNEFDYVLDGVSTMAHYIKNPMYVNDYTGFVGGGKLVHPAYLHMWSHQEGTPSAEFYIYMQMWYTVISISKDQYQELWQAMTLTRQL